IFCQITAGYPYMVVYAYALYSGYALFLAYVTRRREHRIRAAIETAAVLLLPALLTLPYTSAISALMRLTTDRAGGDFQYAIAYPMGPLDFVGSLLFPPVATVEGCFY